MLMNNFMLNFVNNFSNQNQEEAHTYSNDLINNSSFKDFLNTSHSSFMNSYSNLNSNPLIQAQIPYQNCPVYQMNPEPLVTTPAIASKCPFNFTAKD